MSGNRQLIKIRAIKKTIIKRLTCAKDEVASLFEKAVLRMKYLVDNPLYKVMFTLCGYEDLL